MNEEKHFECKAGICGKCCSEKGFKIPVTLGDLYRNYVVERLGGSKKTFYQVFEERCSSWMVMPSRDLPLPIPVSRMPCFNYDTDRKVCKVHDKARYVTCGAYPEECLLDVEPGMIDIFELSSDARNYSLTLDCLKNAKLTSDEKERIIDIAKLRSNEFHITGGSLNHSSFPILLYPNLLNTVEPLLDHMMKLMERKGQMERMWKCIGQTQKEYMRLFDVRYPDYTVLVI